MSIFKRDTNKKSKSTILKQIEYRIIIIGRNLNLAGITSYKWENIPHSFNFADYNRVLIDFTSLSARILNDHNISFQFYSFNFIDLFANENAEIIIIGSPEVFVHSTENTSRYFDPKHLFPAFLGHKTVSGKSFEVINKRFSEYFKYIDSYNYQFENKYKTNHWDMNYIDVYCQQLSTSPSELKIYSNSIANNLSGNSIANNIRFEYIKSSSGEKKFSAQIFWLPPAKEELIESTIISLLSNYGIKQVSNFPDWVAEYSLPNIKKEEKILSNLSKQQDELLNNICLVEKRLENEREYLRLLFENGPALEKIIIQSLIFLGGKITHTSTSKEDIRVVDPQNRQYIIEVKGRKGNFKREEIRQINEWATKARLEENWHGKMLIFGNYNINTPLRLRNIEIHAEDQQILSDYSIGLILTSDLFQMLSLLQSGNLSVNFWDIVYTKSGLISFDL